MIVLFVSIVKNTSEFGVSNIQRHINRIVLHVRSYMNSIYYTFEVGEYCYMCTWSKEVCDLGATYGFV